MTKFSALAIVDLFDRLNNTPALRQIAFVLRIEQVAGKYAAARDKAIRPKEKCHIILPHDVERALAELQ